MTKSNTTKNNVPTKFKFTESRIQKLDFAPGKQITCRDESTPYLLLRVGSTSKVFAYRRVINGKPFQHTFGEWPSVTLEMARKGVLKLNSDLILNDKDVNVTKALQKAEITLGQLWEHYRKNRAKGKGKISAEWERIWARYFHQDTEFKYNRKSWVDKKLSDITFDMAEDFIVQQERPRAPIVANRVHAFLKAMYTHAQKNLNWHGKNPFTFSQFSEVDTKRIDYIIEVAEVPAFVEALKDVSPTMRMLFITTLFTGRRIGECCKMRWDELNLEWGIWGRGNKMVGTDGKPLGIKTKTGRQMVTLLPILCEFLARWKTVTHDDLPESERSPWVFPGRTADSSHVVTYHPAWKKIQKHGFEHLRPNDLRGSHGSFMACAGIDYKSIQQQLGHASHKTTMDRYAKVERTQQMQNVEKGLAPVIEAMGGTVSLPADENTCPTCGAKHTEH